jgi:hypothetical protein
MSKELNRVTSKPVYRDLKVSSRDTIAEQALKYEIHQKEYEDSYVTDFFQGQSMTEIQ